MRCFLKKSALIILFIYSINMGFSTELYAESIQTLRVMTPLNAATTTTFKRAFENKYPHIKIEVIKEKTNESIKIIEETRHNNNIDIFWASSPDAFQILKEKKLLYHYVTKNVNIPRNVGLLPINDVANYYKGFAVSGYGIMENSYYMNALGLPPAREWHDLKKSIYADHISMSSASKSGTTHLIVEILLQGEGWEQGWLSWKEIAANLKNISKSSADVPDGVNKGRFGIGLVIDYYALSYKSLGFPINFNYPSRTALLPANIAIVNNAPNIKSAKLFIDFILSDTGQKILLTEKISRLPVRPTAYVDTNGTFPNPFVKANLGNKVKFDVSLSTNRYEVVNSLFDIMITYNLAELKKAVLAIRAAENIIIEGKSPTADNLLKKAKQSLAWVPVDAAKAGEARFNTIFEKRDRKRTTKKIGRMITLEQEWDNQIKNNYAKAVLLAQQALQMQ